MKEDPGFIGGKRGTEEVEPGLKYLLVDHEYDLINLDQKLERRMLS